MITSVQIIKVFPALHPLAHAVINLIGSHVLEHDHQPAEFIFGLGDSNRTEMFKRYLDSANFLKKSLPVKELEVEISRCNNFNRGMKREKLANKIGVIFDGLEDARNTIGFSLSISH